LKDDIQESGLRMLFNFKFQGYQLVLRLVWYLRISLNWCL